jgi:ADP-ribosylglycohydrolase
MVLGAYAGMDGIPDQWVEALNQRRHIARLLDALDAA